MEIKNRCGITRLFPDAVKQTLDGPHASDHTFLTVWGTRRLVVCGPTLLDNQVPRPRSFLLRMSSFRLVVLDTLDMLCRKSSVWTMQRYRETEKQLQHSEHCQRRLANEGCKRATKRRNSTCSMHDMLLHSQVKRNTSRSGEYDRPLRDNQDSDDVLVHVRIDPLIPIRTLFQAITHNPHRQERPSKLVRRSVPGFHVGR